MGLTEANKVCLEAIGINDFNSHNFQGGEGGSDYTKTEWDMSFSGPEVTMSKAYLGQYSHLVTPIFIEFLQWSQLHFLSSVTNSIFKICRSAHTSAYSKKKINKNPSSMRGELGQKATLLRLHYSPTAGERSARYCEVQMPLYWRCRIKITLDIKGTACHLHQFSIPLGIWQQYIWKTVI